MIASGLCMMGGCFALENGAAVDSYWPAESVEFSEEISITSLIVYRAFFADGDSENDIAYLKGRFAVLAGAANWTIATGINRPETLQNGRFNVITSTQPLGIHADYGNNRSTIRSSYGDAEVFMHMENGSASIYVNDNLFSTLTDTYMIGSSLTRSISIRSLTARKFDFEYYYNARTGVRFQVQPMLAPGGSPALYSDLDDSLIEV
jgi:hypothetical protein